MVLWKPFQNSSYLELSYSSHPVNFKYTRTRNNNTNLHACISFSLEANWDFEEPENVKNSRQKISLWELSLVSAAGTKLFPWGAARIVFRKRKMWRRYSGNDSKMADTTPENDCSASFRNRSLCQLWLHRLDQIIDFETKNMQRSSLMKQ